MNLLKKFDENIKFRKLFLYWIGFFIVGVFLMELITPLSSSFEEPINELEENYCKKTINLILIILAPITETFFFLLVPHWIWKKKGVIIGIIIWVLIHLLIRTFPFIIYISLIGYFYYRCVEIGRWKSIVFFHFIPNFIGLLFCFIL